MKSSFIQRYFFGGLLLVGFGLGAALFWPYLIIMLLAAVFAVLLHPLFNWFRRFLRFPSLAAFVTILSFIVILCTPLFFIVLIIIKQSQSMYGWLTSHGSLSVAINNVTLWLHHILPTVSFDIQGRVNTFIASAASRLTTVLTGTVSTLISFLLMLLVLFYLLRDGKKWKEMLINLSPLSEESNIKIVGVMKNAINGIMKGYFVVGIAQGIVTGIGLFIFHVPHAALWGSLAAVASLVPNIGTGLISIPVIIFLFLSNRIGAGVGYLLWALLISGTIDNILNPLVVGKQIAIHPVLVLFSILGGITLLGPAGIVVGPLTISFIYALLAVYKHEMGGDTQAIVSVE